MNSPENHIYPDHLYDDTRREIAIQLLDKEIRKQLLSDPVDENIDVRSWMEDMDDHTFWNTVEGFMGGALLKPIVHFLTAENYTWSERDINVIDIQLSSKLTQLDSFDDLQSDKLLLSSIKERLDRDETERVRQLETIEQHHRSDEQDDYSIIAVEKEGRPMVMDGNRRSLQALLVGKETIHAWYCQTNDEQPRNYWFPIDDMMRLTKLYSSSKDTDPAIREHVQGVLRAIFTQSNVARIAYQERIAKVGTSGAQELMEDI